MKVTQDLEPSKYLVIAIISDYLWENVLDGKNIHTLKLKLDGSLPYEVYFMPCGFFLHIHFPLFTERFLFFLFVSYLFNIGGQFGLSVTAASAVFLIQKPNSPFCTRL